MKKPVTRRTGDRPDGRLINNLTTYDKYGPYFNPSSTGSSNMYDDSIYLGETTAWLRDRATGEFAGLNLLHVIIAAYVRTVSAMPAINRFISGQRVYARHDISVIITAARKESDRRAARFVKVSFEPGDDVYDVYRKIAAGVQAVRTGATPANALPFPEGMLKLPRPAVRLAFWALRVADYFGKLPRHILENSGVHGSMSICTLSVHGAQPTYVSLGEWGNLPMTMSISTTRSQGNDFLHLRSVYDARIADVLYFTEAFAYMKELIRNPSLLEGRTNDRFEDIF